MDGVILRQNCWTFFYVLRTVHFPFAQFHPALGADTLFRRLEPLPNLQTCLLKMGLKTPETCKAEVNR
jgi:hypothetical protein